VAQTKTCPSCGAEVPSSAFRCKDCFHDFNAQKGRNWGPIMLLGTVTAGKLADLVVIQGNPAANPADIRKVTTGFKGGGGYDSAKLDAAGKGKGDRERRREGERVECGGGRVG